MREEPKFSQEEFKEAQKAFNTLAKYCQMDDITLVVSGRPNKGVEFITSMKLMARKRKSIRHKLQFNSDSKCAHCGSKDKLVGDHIFPFAKGGTDDESNLQILCSRCNSFKSDDSDERLKSGGIAIDMVRYYVERLKNPSKEPWLHPTFATRKEYDLHRLNNIYIPPHRKGEYYELVKLSL